MAVISDAMWEDAFGRKDVSNRTMMVNGVARAHRRRCAAAVQRRCSATTVAG